MTLGSNRLRIEYLALAIITCGAAAMRFYGLDIQSLWNDELSSWIRSTYPTVKEVIDEGSRPDVHPPGFQILLWAVIHLFGDSPPWLRASSAVAGTLAVPAIYLLARRIYSDSVTALGAAALLAVAKC